MINFILKSISRLYNALVPKKKFANIHNILSHSLRSTILLSIIFFLSFYLSRALTHKQNTKQLFCFVFFFLSLSWYILHRIRATITHPYVVKPHAVHIFGTCSIIKISLKYMTEQHFSLRFPIRILSSLNYMVWE